jgi:transcriptional regulator with XRE-family HTH domain
MGGCETAIMGGMDDELGASLRTWRDRLQPIDAGLPAGRGRRAPGLRREEVAGLAGLSVDYLARLEQGRADRPSPSVLGALARALRLDDGERAHLYRLAGHVPPGDGRIDAHITPGVQRVLDRLVDSPVLVCDAAWNMVATNALWDALMGDISHLPARHRNIAWRAFLDDEARVRHDGQERADFECEIVADLREATGRYPHDEALAALITDLRAASPAFAGRWACGAARPHSAARKTIDHPQVGPIELDCDILTVRDSDLRLIVYSAPAGSPAAGALALLGAVGLQSFST